MGEHGNIRMRRRAYRLWQGWHTTAGMAWPGSGSVLESTVRDSEDLGRQQRQHSTKASGSVSSICSRRRRMSCAVNRKWLGCTVTRLPSRPAALPTVAGAQNLPSQQQQQRQRLPSP